MSSLLPSEDAVSWPAELPTLSERAWAQVDRWTYQRLLAYYGGTWIDACDVPTPEEDDEFYPVPDVPTLWVGCGLTMCSAYEDQATAYFIQCRAGLRRTRPMYGPYYDLVRAGLAVDVLGEAALPELRSVVSLAFGLGLLVWVEDPTGPARV